MADYSDPAYHEGVSDGMAAANAGDVGELVSDFWHLFYRVLPKYAYLLSVLIFTILAFGKVAGVALFAAPFLFRKYLWRGSRKVWYYLGLFGVAFLVLSAHGGTLVAPDHTAHPVAHSAAR
jgi:hypothetical protein